MKMHFATVAISLVALTLGGCGKKVDTTTNESAAAPVNSVNTAEPTPMAQSAGQQFANAAAASDTFEIESSRLAETNSQSATIKKFAASMIKAHTDSTAKLGQAASAASPTIVPAPLLTGAQQQSLDALKGKKGADFDAAYIQAQTKGHQETLEKLKAYSANGDVPSLKEFATKLVPVVTGHLNMAKGLKS